MGERNIKKRIIVIGSGIGGLTIALELVERGFDVLVLDKDNKPGGIMQSIVHDDYIVDIGFRSYYPRIPDVLNFFKKVLGKDFISYDHRIGVLYKNKIYEREYRFRGFSRGLSLYLISIGLLDLIYNKIKFSLSSPTNFEQKAYSKKGAIFTKIFAKSFFEKLKGIPWASLPHDYDAERFPKKENTVFGGLIDRIKLKIDDQYEWFHPKLGSRSLIDSIYKEAEYLGCKFKFNISVSSVNNSPDERWTVFTSENGLEQKRNCDILVAALPIEHTARLLQDNYYKTFKSVVQRHVIIVYLFLNDKPLFPHNCLRVTDESTSIARITNYGSYNGEMVPKGKGCLGIEYFYSDKDEIESIEDEALLKYTIEFCVKSKLISSSSVSQSNLYRFLNTEVASSWEDFRNDIDKMNLFSQLAETPNFFQINRTGIDKTIYAAIEAAKAIEYGDQTEYITKTAPNINQPWKTK